MHRGPEVALRVLAGVGAESGLPSSGSFVSTSMFGTKVEITLESVSFSGSPVSCTLFLWRKRATKIVKIGQVYILDSEIEAPVMTMHDAYANEFWVTVGAFEGGSSPSFSGTVRIAPIQE
jgi:hypothetical protein